MTIYLSILFKYYMSIIWNSFFHKLIEALINSGAFTDSSEEEKMKKLGFATGTEVRKYASV